MANPIFSSLPTTIFEEMSGLARDAGRGQPRPGLPGRSGAGGDPRQGRRRGAERLQPVSADGRPAGAAPGGGRPLCAARQGLDLDWQSEVTVTSGATEALAAAFLGADRAGRRGGGLPAALRRLPAADPPGRRRAEAGAACSRRDWRFDRAMLEAAFSAAHPVRGAEQPEQSRRRGAAATRTWRCWPSSASRHDVIAICDEVWEQVVFDGRAPPAADRLSRHARALA